MDTMQCLRNEFERCLSVSEFELIASLFKGVTRRRKELMPRSKDHQEGLTFVCRGCIKFFVIDDSGEEEVLSFIIDRGWFGESAAEQLHMTYDYAAVIEDSEMLSLSRDHCERLLASSEAFAELINRLRAQWLAESQRKLALWHTLSAEKRYESFVVSSPELMQRIPRHDIASYLGIRPQSLSRLEKRLVSRARKRRQEVRAQLPHIEPAMPRLSNPVGETRAA
jgi:CRP-like cAMP-binding protein